MTTCYNSIRISDHSLNIERGRYTRPKTERENRLCPHCQQIETEIHFLLECKKYDKERKTLLSAYNIDLNDNDLPSKLMNPVNVAEAYGLINYIKHSTKIRNTE